MQKNSERVVLNLTWTVLIKQDLLGMSDIIILTVEKSHSLFCSKLLRHELQQAIQTTELNNNAKALTKTKKKNS